MRTPAIEGDSGVACRSSRPLAEVPIFALVEAFQRVLSRAKVKLAHDVVPDRISITDRIHELFDMLTARRRAEFEELFAVKGDEVTRFDLVVTFLALLEMTRLRMMRLYQVEPLGPLHVELNEGADASQVNEG